MRAPLFVGVVIAVLVAGVGLAVAGEDERDAPVAAGGFVGPEVTVFETFAAAEVEAARETLIADVMNDPPSGFSGASFEIDESVGKVIARYFFGEAPGVVPAAAIQLGDLVRATVEAGELGASADVYAGHVTSRGGFELSCTLGWAVDIVDGPNPEDQDQGMMTAGHCFDADKPPEDTVFSIRTPVVEKLASAVGVAHVYGPPGDYGYLRLNSGDTGHPAVDTPAGQKLVRGIGDPVVGATICKFGRVTKETCGKIERVNVSTVVRGHGETVLLTGMVRTSYCADPGDSGGPVYANYTGFGATDLSIMALGLQASSILHMQLVGGLWKLVCGEKVGKPNEALFTPLSNIDTADRFFVKIAGG